MVDTSAQDWTPDAVGNWSAFDNNGSLETRTHNALNQLTGRSTLPATLLFDPNGNQIANGAGGLSAQGYVYDPNDRIRRIFRDDGSGIGGMANDGIQNGSEPTIAEYAYDALGRRVSKLVHIPGPNQSAGLTLPDAGSPGPPPVRTVPRLPRLSSCGIVAFEAVVPIPTPPGNGLTLPGPAMSNLAGGYKAPAKPPSIPGEPSMPPTLRSVAISACLAMGFAATAAAQVDVGSASGELTSATATSVTVTTVDQQGRKSATTARIRPETKIELEGDPLDADKLTRGWEVTLTYVDVDERGRKERFAQSIIVQTVRVSGVLDRATATGVTLEVRDGEKVEKVQVRVDKDTKIDGLEEGETLARAKKGSAVSALLIRGARQPVALSLSISPGQADPVRPGRSGRSGSGY